MSRFQVSTVKFHNPTGELVRRGQWGRNYTFYPDKITEVRAEHAEVLEPILKPYGIYPIVSGDDQVAVKNAALQAYARYLEARIANYQTWMNVREVVGMKTPAPSKMKMLQVWLEELTEMLSQTPLATTEFSFKKNTGKVAEKAKKSTPASEKMTSDSVVDALLD